MAIKLNKNICKLNKKGKKLKEGYLGQTLQDFLDVCIDEYVIDKIYVYGTDDIVYEGPMDDLPDDMRDAEFLEFEAYSNGKDEVTINVDSTEEYGLDTYYATLEDFLDDCNNENIIIFDLGSEEEIFRGDKYDIPDEVKELIFASFDSPNELSVNLSDYAGDSDDYAEDEDDEDFDEGLEESRNNIPEKANLKKVLDRFNSNGKFAKQGNWKIARGGYDLAFQLYYDNLALLDGIAGAWDTTTRLELDQDTYGTNDEYNVKDLANYVCQVYKDCKIDENLKEAKDTKDTLYLVRTKSGVFEVRAKNDDLAVKQARIMQDEPVERVVNTTTNKVVFNLEEDYDESLKENEQPFYRVIKNPKGKGYCILKRVNKLDKANTFINDHSKEVFNTPEEAKAMLDKVDELHFYIDENLKETKVNEAVSADGLKTLLQDYKDGKFELDSLYIDSDGWVATDYKYYDIEDDEPLKESVNYNELLKDAYKLLDDANIKFDVEGTTFEFNDDDDAENAWKVLAKKYGKNKVTKKGLFKVKVDLDENLKESTIPVKDLLVKVDNKYGITLDHAIDDIKKKKGNPHDSLLGDEGAISTLMKRFGIEKRDVIRALNYKFDGKVLDESIEDDMEKLPHVVMAYKDGGKYILELQWRPTTRKTHSDYVDISQALNNKYGKDNVNIKCQKQDWRDGNKETHYVLEVELKDKEIKEDISPLAKKMGAKFMPPKDYGVKKRKPRYVYEVYYFTTEDCKGDPVYRRFSSRKAQEQWYEAHENDPDKFGMYAFDDATIYEGLGEAYNTEDRIKELKEIKKTRALTDDELEELAYCENEVSSRDAEQRYLNGESLDEEVHQNWDDVEFTYNKLPIVKLNPDTLDHTPMEVDFTHKVTREDVEDALFNILENKGELDDYNLEDGIAYVMNNFDELVNKYEEELKSMFIGGAIHSAENEGLDEDLDTFDDQMDFLAKDEQEAIDGYKEVINKVDNKNVKTQLKKIETEEKAHKDYLTDVKKDKDLEYTEPLDEDTVKKDGKWVNKGNTGKTHGEFKTKKEADAQRKAMFAGRKPNAKWGK